MLGDCLMIRSTFKKQSKSPFTLILYYILMGLSFGLIYCSMFEVIWASNTFYWLAKVCITLFIMSLLLNVVVTFSNPGYLDRDDNIPFTGLLDTIEASSLCPDCYVIRSPRCRHCNLCNRCIDRFDHHCPWINNCIGKGNFRKFYAFVFVQLFYLLFIVFAAGVYIKLDFFDDVMVNEHEDHGIHLQNRWRRLCGIVAGLLSLLFLFSVM
jgi:hypothetical protein